MILDATILSHFQACKRRHALERTWRARRWRPRILFEHWLRRGVFALSNGTAPEPTFSHTRSQFLAACADPGLDLPSGAAAYTQAKDWATALDTVLRTVSRLTLLSLRQLPPAQIAPGVQWRFSSPVDDSGTLHRWISVSAWDEDELARQAHGWWSSGDMMIARQDLMLHVVEVGSLRRGRRDSCWTRAYRHPSLPNLKLKFRRADGGEAFGGLVPVYLADLPQQSPDAWVEELFRCGLARERIHHVTLTCPGDRVCEDTARQVIQEAQAIDALGLSDKLYHHYPMSRSACDGLVPCPFQHVCYSPEPLDAGEIQSLGLYVPVPVPVAPRAAALPPQPPVVATAPAAHPADTP